MTTCSHAVSHGTCPGQKHCADQPGDPLQSRVRSVHCDVSGWRVTFRRMSVRPSQKWADAVAGEARAVEAGTLSPDEAYKTALYPLSVMAATDEVLVRFEVDLSALADLSDVVVLGLVERTVIALNAVNEELDHPYETVEREELCKFLDDALTEAGTDVGTLMRRQGRDRAELTDAWRDW